MDTNMDIELLRKMLEKNVIGCRIQNDDGLFHTPFNYLTREEQIEQLLRIMKRGIKIEEITAKIQSIVNQPTCKVWKEFGLF